MIQGRCGMETQDRLENGTRPIDLSEYRSMVAGAVAVAVAIALVRQDYFPSLLLPQFAVGLSSDRVSIGPNICAHSQKLRRVLVMAAEK